MRTVIFAMLIGLFSTAAIGQTKEAREEKNEEKSEGKEMQSTIPVVVTQAFAKDYPGSKASWDAEDGGFEAEFKLNGADASATYTKAGHRESAEIAIKTAELPASVMDYVRKNYPLHKMTEAAKITDDKNIVTYETELGKDGKSWDVIFDAKGKFIKEAEVD